MKENIKKNHTKPTSPMDTITTKVVLWFDVGRTRHTTMLAWICGCPCCGLMQEGQNIVHKVKSY